MRPDPVADAPGLTSAGRRGPSIFVKQVALYLVLILLVGGVTSQLFFTTARAHLEEEVGGKLETVARIATRHTPLERLELIRVGDDQSRMVLRLRQRLEEIQEATAVLNLYVFRPDLTCLLDLDSSVVIGTAYTLPHYTERLRATIAGGASAHTLGYETPSGDLRMSAFAPVVDSTGAVAAIVGVDAGAAELVIVERMRQRLYWITGACAAAALLAALGFARSIAGPVRHIADVARRLGQGDYAARASVRTRDEVEVLAVAVNRMAKQVRERDAALKEIAASVAHEIRNPLNSIKLLLTLLADDIAAGRTEGLQESLATLEYEIGKLNRFTDEFLTYSRPASRIRDPIDVDALAAGIVDMAAAEAREHAVEMRVESGRSSPAVSGDRQRLEQAMLNLVINAIQAAGRGGRVTVRAVAADDGVDLVVQDSGPGVPEEHLERLFEPFFTTKTDGTGLGLANAGKIAREHGGHIRADNTAAGARFTLHLPAAHGAGGA